MSKTQTIAQSTIWKVGELTVGVKWVDHNPKPGEGPVPRGALAGITAWVPKTKATPVSRELAVGEKVAVGGYEIEVLTITKAEPRDLVEVKVTAIR